MILKHLSIAAFAISLVSCSQSSQPIVKPQPIKGDLAYRIHLFEAPKGFSSSKKEPWEHFIGAISQEEGEKMISRLKTKRGYKLRYSPTAHARFGQTVTMEHFRPFKYATEYDPPKFPEKKQGIFPVTPAVPTKFATTDLGLKATVTGKRLSNFAAEIDLKLSHRAFLGFVNYGQPITGSARNFLGMKTTVVLAENRIEMPVFSTLRSHTNLTVKSGEFLLFHGVAHDYSNSRLALEKPEGSSSGNVIALVQIEARE